MGSKVGNSPRPGASPRDDVSVVVVTYDALPWIEQCLTSIEGYEAVVVDHGSTDGTVEEVRRRFPKVRVVEQENRGLGAGWNRGIRETAGAYVLILNADAWALDDAVERLPPSRTRTRVRRWSARGFAIPTAGFNLRFAAFRRPGASQRSTSSSASSRRARAR